MHLISAASAALALLCAFIGSPARAERPPGAERPPIPGAPVPPRYVPHPLAGAPLAGQASYPPVWGYTGARGPAHWSELDPDYYLCDAGRRQSPVDISVAYTEEIVFDRQSGVYREVRAQPIELHYDPSPLDIIDDGHTLEVTDSSDSHIIVNGRRYDLVSYQLHTPSEHTIGGQHYDMAVQLLHRGNDENADEHYVIVAVLVRQGAANPTLQTLLEHRPGGVNQERHLDDVRVDPAGLLPHDRGYYRYSGSLTTPPCSEGVEWYVLKSPIQASARQIEALKALFGNNVRPIQPLHGRRVLMTTP